MTKVIVHRFKVWNSLTDEMVTSSRYATLEAIKETAHGVAIDGTGIEVDAADLGADIHGFTAKGYKPAP